MIQLKLITEDHKKMLKNGFRQIGDKQYELKFDVYKAMINCTIMLDTSTNFADIEVTDKNLHCLYHPYYNNPRYSDLVAKQVNRNIMAKAKRLQKAGIIEIESKDMDKARGFEVIGKEQYRKDFDINEEVVIKLPRRATKGSAGYDCFAPIDIALEPGKDIKVPTGIRAYMKQGEVLMAFPRSGLGFKYYCRLANTVGIIDSDYYYSDNEGHIFIKLRNEGDKPLIIRQGEAMCQFIFVPFLLADGDSFENGEKRNGGFGSTTK